MNIIDLKLRIVYDIYLAFVWKKCNVDFLQRFYKFG